MKPFDLEKALAGDPVVTRSGDLVTKICMFEDSREVNPLVASINGYIRSFTINGVHQCGAVSPYDLFMAPKKRTVWVNLYSEIFTTGTAIYYSTEKEADMFGSPARIGGKAWPLEIEE